MRYFFVGACQRFEGFVWIGVALSPQHCLYGLGHDSPVVFQVGGYLVAVDYQFAQPFHCGTYGQQRMSERHAHVSQDSRVRQVSLQARYRQFCRQMFEQCVGNAQVALGIFEIYRVYLVRHGA